MSKSIPVHPDFTSTATITPAGEVLATSRTGDLLKELAQDYAADHWVYLRAKPEDRGFHDLVAGNGRYAEKLEQIAKAIDEEFIGKDRWFDIKRLTWFEKTLANGAVSGLNRIRNRLTQLPHFTSIVIDMGEFSVYYSNHNAGASIALLTR
jgi:hypothetical protein